jgi:LacI family transcriptional regulator
VIYATVYHRQFDVGPAKLPHVLLNCFDGANRHPAIVPDDYQLGHTVTSAIFDKGYERPIFLNLEAEIVASQLRAKGFIDAGRMHGRDLSGRIYNAVATKAGVEKQRFVVDQILPGMMQGADRPDVILCGQDPMAMVVYQVLADLGFRVGRDIAVASFDDQKPIVDLLRPGLSTMALPYYEMGRLAMRMAIDGVTGKTVVRLPGTLVDRQSL